MRGRVSVSLVGSLCLAVVAAGSIQGARLSAASRQTQPTTSEATSSQYRAVLDQYCVTCHNERLRTGGLALDKMDLSDVSRGGEVWEKVVRKLRFREMPPTGRRRPDEATYDGFASWLETSLDTAAIANRNPGRPALHRLNRTEYANAIRDLLGLEIDASVLLPVDDSTHGFDNIADVLGVSPLLLESYLTAAQKISRLAVGNSKIKPVRVVYRAPTDQTQNYHLDGLPLGTRGGMAASHHFPLDGQYEIRIRLSRNHYGMVQGLDEPHNIELAVDGSRVQLFSVEGGRKMYEATRYEAQTLSTTADAHLHVRVPVKAGPHVITATFPVKTFGLVETPTKPTLRSYLGNSQTVHGLAHVGAISISGPYLSTGPGDTPSRRRIFTCRPTSSNDELPCAKKIISRLARRAYRGVISAADLQSLLGFYQVGSETGGFEAGIESALLRILSSPEFVFRFEFDPPDIAPGGVYPISDLELASRLSFFLWSSIPDDQLLDLAVRGELRRPGVLEQQVRRMLAHPQSRALVDNFAGQWLYLRNLKHIVPDPATFPDFDDNLREAFRRETELLFESVIREDRSVLELLNADYTFVNDRLATHYGMPNIGGSHFRKVAVSDENRRGLLGHGSMLTVTSYTTRTSPVQRGKWVLENLLGMPPPPPPPDVPDLNEDDEKGKVLSMRERMSEHRANPVCASCHAKMDPIGFGLENFDAVGAWRMTEGTIPIDSSGMLPSGLNFDGPAELRRALLQRPEAFVGTMTTKLLTYALGRGIEYYDVPVVRAITTAAAQNNYSYSSIVLGIVKSIPFQMRRATEYRLPAVTTSAFR